MNEHEAEKERRIEAKLKEARKHREAAEGAEHRCHEAMLRNDLTGAKAWGHEAQYRRQRAAQADDEADRIEAEA